jgi:peptidoglycan hydrolase CwlO-like protein
MQIDPNQKLEALKSELQQIAKNYNEAKEVMTNCERKILQIQGGIAACEEIIKEEETTES